jgi:hypothetical protein
MAQAVGRWQRALDRPLPVVAVAPLTGGRRPEAFYSTCYEADGTDVLTWYSHRWAMEQTNQESKGHLGFEEPQGWSRAAVERTTPMAMLLYSLIVLWFASEGHRHYTPLLRPWYRTKRSPCFVDMLATLRRLSSDNRFLHGACAGQDPAKPYTRSNKHSVMQHKNCETRT